MFTDTETTGLPPKGAHWEVDYMLFPYVVTLSWKIGKVTKTRIIYQEGRDIPKEATKIHGITTSMGNDKRMAVPAMRAYKEFMEDSEKANVHTVVGHNIYFDASIIKANVLRIWGPQSKEAERIKEVLHKDKRQDTMRSSQILTRKWAKLEVLYEFLFSREMKGAHSSEADVLACEECYYELVKRRVI